METGLLTVRTDDQLDCLADQFGARAVYYAEKADRVFVSTNIGELHGAGEVQGVDFEVARNRLLGEWWAGSLARGPVRVPPGNRLSVTAGQVVIHPVTGPKPIPTEGLRRAQLSTALLDRLGDAVDSLLGRRQPVLALSGGLDSAALLALVEDRSPRTWTVVSGIRDPALRMASRVASAFGSEHHTVEVADEELTDGFEAAVQAAETLVCNGRAIRRQVMYRMIAEHGDRWVLSGVGADLLLMGDPLAFEGVPGGRFMGDRDLTRKLLDPAFAVPPHNPLPARNAEEARDKLLSDWLPLETMPLTAHGPTAYGVDVLLPYLARPVVELALGLKAQDLVHNGVGKTLLREAWEGIVDDETRLRPKALRLPPVPLTPALHSRWCALYDGLLSEERLADLPLLRTRAVRGLIAAYAKESRRDHPGFAVMDRVLKRLASLSVLERAWS